MTTRKNISGMPEGQFVSEPLNPNHFTMTLERLSFFDAQGIQVIPTQGMVFFEYQTAVDETWFPFDTDAMHDFSAGDHRISSASGKMLRRARITFSGFESGITFKLSLFATPDKSLQNVELERSQIASFDAFNQNKSVQYSPIIELKSIYGTSVLRDTETTSGNGKISLIDAELVLNGAAGGDSAELRSAERGRYQSGTIGITGIGIRVIRLPADAGSYAEWGYFDDNDGFGYGVDADGLYTFVKKSGTVVRKVYQSDWVVDSLDGTGKSRVRIKATDGLVYRIPFLWYGYGSITFEVVHRDVRGDQTIRVDNAQFRGGVSVLNPNLPVSAKVVGDCEISVGGRQYGVYGRYNPSRRIVGDYRLEQSVGTDIAPLVSFKSKSGIYGSVSIKLQGIVFISDEALVISIRSGGTLTGENYRTPQNHSASEAAVDYDVSATAITGGEQVFIGLAAGGGRGNSTELSSTDLPQIDIPPNTPITVCARTLSRTAVVTTVFKDTEEW